MTRPLHKREGYWESRREPVWAFAELTSGPAFTMQTGVPALRYNPDLTRDGGIVVTFGHTQSMEFYLELSWPDALEFFEMFTAAVRDGHIDHGADLEPVPYVDVTMQDCHCRYCTQVGGAR